MLEQLEAKMGKGLYAVCKAAGHVLADVIDKGIDKLCDYVEKEKEVKHDHM